MGVSSNVVRLMEGPKKEAEPERGDRDYWAHEEIS